MERFNPSARKSYVALCIGLALVSALTYVLAGTLEIGAQMMWVPYAAYCAAFVLGVAASAIGTRLTTYEISDLEVLVRKGILNREERIIPFDRIDNISMKEPFDEKIFGLASIYIDTPASSDYEIVMKGLSLGDARKVVAVLRKSAVERQDRGEKAARRMEKAV